MGRGLEPHPGLGDHAEGALGAEQEAIGLGAGARARQPPALPTPRGVIARTDSTRSSMCV